MTLDDLRSYGANVDEGLTRFVGNEELYLKWANNLQSDEHFDALEAALAKGDWHNAFDAAHALKGYTGNLSIAPLYDPLCELCVLLRPEKPVDCGQLLDTVLERYRQYQAL